MGWVSFSAEAGYEKENTNQNTYGTRTPNLSQDWKDRFAQFSSSVNDAGATPDQQAGIDWLRGNLVNNPVRGATATANAALEGSRGQLDAVGSGYAAIANRPAPQAVAGLAQTRDAVASTAAAGQAGNAPLINPVTGASMASPYAALYADELIDPSLAAYDYGTDRAFSALDARTAGAGGFANSRSGFNYGDLGAQSALGRGKLASDLRTTGITNALGFGMADAGNRLTADTSNASNILDVNKYNAGQVTDVNKYNAGLLTDTSRFNADRFVDVSKTNAANITDINKANLTAADLATGRSLDALGGQAKTILSQADLSQGVLDNIVKGNSIDMEAAQSLLAAGVITQSQLESIMNAAAAGNGFSFTQNSETDRDQIDGRVSGGFG